MARHRSTHRQPCAVEGHMHEVETERQSKLLADQVAGCPGSRRSVTVFAGICLDQSNQVVDRSRRYRWMDGENQGRGNRERNRIEVLFEFMGDFVVNLGIDHVAGIDDKQGIAVRCGLGGAAHTDIAAATTYVLDKELPCKMLRQSLCEQ